MERDVIVHDGVVVPESPLLRRQTNRYGCVPGLPDEELADPDELERQVFMEEFGPVLRLRVRGRRSPFSPDIDESGRVDWGAFATVDFERTGSGPDRQQGRIIALREQLRDCLIMLSIVSRHLPRARFKVLKYLRLGVIDTEHIVNDDMLGLVRLHRKTLASATTPTASTRPTFATHATSSSAACCPAPVAGPAPR